MKHSARTWLFFVNQKGHFSVILIFLVYRYISEWQSTMVLSCRSLIRYTTQTCLATSKYSSGIYLKPIYKRIRWHLSDIWPTVNDNLQMQYGFHNELQNNLSFVFSILQRSTDLIFFVFNICVKFLKFWRFSWTNRWTSRL